MTNTREAAAEFVRQQIAIMRKHGSEPSLSEEQLAHLLHETERQLKKLTGHSEYRRIC
jgi:hypothetical protein